MYSHLLQERIVVLDTPIEDATASSICGQLLYLEQQSPVDDIFLYINSPGGIITAGLAIYDTMQFIRPRVRTLCFGQAASMAAILLTSGEPGYRYAMPHSRIMVHQPSGGYTGKSSDIQIHAEEINRLKDILLDILEEHSGLDRNTLSGMMVHDTYMSPVEARDLNLIDNIVIRRG